MTQSTQPLPTLGSPNSTEDSKVRSLLSEIQGIVNGNIDNSNVTANAGIAVTKLGVLPACRLIQPVDSAIPNATFTSLSFTSGSEISDPTGMHSETTNPSRITIGTAGWYLLIAESAWAVSATGTRAVRFLLNGATTIGYVEQPAAATTIVQQLTTARYLSAGDYVEVQVYQSSGGSLNQTYTSEHTPAFCAARMGS